MGISIGHPPFKDESYDFTFVMKILKAQYHVGLCYYYYGYGITKGKQLALKYFKILANKDFVAAQWIIYVRIIGTNPDKQKAIEFYQKAANLGHNKALLIFKRRRLCRKDYNKTFELSKKSAEGGYYKGMLQPGFCYYDGIGTGVNKQKGLELIQKANKERIKMLKSRHDILYNTVYLI
ncbi:hypothetical protein RclHR1_02120006 [Rhizophagus clarus]|uniref:HCP-like protein n=1 Tax=Rhizophagus clarus TaxID=94130 RepID=A0A2Z6R5R2_9GLOM|nr:hypothetical protein RclHR1_02120006 [Rhizophagus clarus]